MPKNQSVCKCPVYKFPHREFGGDCQGEELYDIELENARKEAWEDWKDWQKERKEVIDQWS